MKNILEILFGLALMFGGGIFLYTNFIDYTNEKNEQLQEMLEDAGPPVVERSTFSFKVKYTLTNNTDETFDYIQLNADMFDANGVKLDNKWTNITDVTPGQTFELVLYGNSEAVRYKITGISDHPN